MRYYGDKVLHEYEGFHYCPEDDVEPGENIKRFHHIKVKNNGELKYFTSLPLSPYRTASFELLKN